MGKEGQSLGLTPSLQVQQEIRAWFSYDPETGFIYRLQGPRKGTRTDHKGNRYWRVSLKGRYFQAHRVAWFLYYGEWPHTCVDHINGDTWDNRIGNLRLVTLSQNMWNRNPHRYSGTTYDRRKRMWRVRIKVNGKRFLVGYFSTQQDGEGAYLEARRTFHGPYIRTQ